MRPPDSPLPTHRPPAQTISLLACLKLRYPERVTLIRGNHESRQTTMAYGFYAECLNRYKGSDAWRCFTDMFDYLPLAASIDGAILAIHGGSRHTPAHTHARAHARTLARCSAGLRAWAAWSAGPCLSLSSGCRVNAVVARDRSLACAADA